MDEMKKLQRENGRLKMQLELLKQKLYQVCLSHDYLTGKFRGLGLPMTTSDNAMVTTTARIMKAMSTEEVETIYNEAQSKLWEQKFGGVKPQAPKQKPFVEKVFFFGDSVDDADLKNNIMDALEKMITELDRQIKSIEREENGYTSDESDETDEPNDPLKPPF